MVIAAARLAGFFAAHAIWSVSDGATLIPILAYTTESGERHMERLVGELAAMALMKQPGLTKVLDRMERDELLTRRSTSDDRRRVTIHLTPKGRARVKPVQRAAKSHEAELLKQFTAEQRTTIKSALDLLINSRAAGAGSD